MKKFDVIVIGAGHAGIEAANITAKMGLQTLLVTMDIDCIGKLSCNPAVGGIGKSTLVKETDILGGLIGKITDASLVSARVLNRSKGEAVWATRAQVDIDRYPAHARHMLEERGIRMLQAETTGLIIKNKHAVGITTNIGEDIRAQKIILCAGTFLKGIIHIGLTHFSGGRLTERSSDTLHDTLKKWGIRFKYFKTGTCARLDTSSLDYRRMIEQKPDRDFDTFSLFSQVFPRKSRMLSCYITHTGQKTHDIILKNLKYSPLYTGIIKATGVRYCPSIEDKIVKFKDKGRHQIFIEPEGFDSREVYLNGISTSLPVRVQQDIIQSIPGLENARMIRPGYGIEHAVIEARQLSHTLESNVIKDLYCAGQINGTTGYEEAAAQGIIAGINAGLSILKKKPLVLNRDESLTGVLIDDLVTKGTDEPYRMFTARAEYRLTLRESNAFSRLASHAYQLRLLTDAEYAQAREAIQTIADHLTKYRTDTIQLPGTGKISLYEALKRPEVGQSVVRKRDPGFAKLRETIRREIMIAPKYEGFLKREQKSIQDLSKIARVKIPAAIDYTRISGLSREVIEKLKKESPRSLRDAFAISGITPASIMILYAYLNRTHHVKNHAKNGNRKNIEQTSIR